MKKIIKFVIFILLFCLIVGIAYNLFFKVDKSKLAYDSISEIRYNYFIGSDDLSHVNLSSGYRENPYAIDGKHEEMVPFGVVVFRTILLDISEPSYMLRVGEMTYEGVMERNPLDGTYVCDTETYIDEGSEISLEVKVADSIYKFNLTCESSKWEITADEAFNIALESLGDGVNTLIKGKEFQGECYVKIVADPNNMLNIYYWYVSIVDRDGNTIAAVIDSNTGEVLSISK